MQRLQMLAGHASAPKRKEPVSDVWVSMGLDDHLRPEAVAMRKATGHMMDSLDLDKSYDEARFPTEVIDKLRQLKITGLQIKGYGSPGLTTVEAGAMLFEIAKRDGSIASFFTVHNAIGLSVINALGDEEQKQRLLTPGMNFDKIFCFGLTEPENGSDASGLRTTATKVEGGYLLNGRKRWIGNGTFGDVIVWARNPADGNRV